VLAILQQYAQDVFRHSIEVVQRDIRAGVISSRANAADRHWERVTFCQAHHLYPYVFEYEGPFPILQVFATRYGSGEITPSGLPVRAPTVEDAICAVGEKFSSMGAHDVRKTPTGDIDFCIQPHLKCCGKEDNPPTKVLLIPSITFSDEASEGNQDVAHMIVINFFYLLRSRGGGG
jgi:hypothetical protein